MLDREDLNPMEQGLQLSRRGVPKNGVYYAQYSKAARGRKEVEKEVRLTFIPKRRAPPTGNEQGSGVDFYQIKGTAMGAAGYTQIVQGYLSARTGKAYWVERSATGVGLLLLSIVTFDWEKNTITHGSSWRTRYGRTGEYKRFELRTLVSVADQEVSNMDADDVHTAVTEEEENSLGF